MNIKQTTISPGNTSPLGASYSPQGVNFAIIIMDALRVSLTIYRKKYKKALKIIELDPQINKTGNVWHVYVSGLEPGDAYEYRITNKELHEKVLLDPYSKAYFSNTKWGKKSKLINSRKEKVLRISSITNGNYDWQGDRPLNLPENQTIIYEMHVRGFTRHKSSKVSNPGTFSGIVEKIPYLKDLGITAIELLPVFDFDENGIDRVNPKNGKSLKNYWGYDPISFFALKNTYAINTHPLKAINEFRDMVKALHKAGIEVILDVVFNHTAEGGENERVLNFKGLAKTVYYHITKDNEYSNFTGCGNTVNCNHPIVKDMIVNALKYWVTEMHVDGFRFDLAAILCRDKKGRPTKNPALIDRISHEPVLSETKLIAEPWDAAGYYLVGNFPGGRRWMEWNGKFRDDVRMFIKDEDSHLPDLAQRLFGSSDLYQKTGRSPLNSINFITSHDGFPLADLVSYSQKHNQANGENNNDGENYNHSTNYGIEGPSTDPEIKDIRQRQIKNMIALLMLSQGIPMFNAGDEFGRSQGGNNNAYCQDNEISWIDWRLVKKNRDLFHFFKMMIRFRKKHPALRRTEFKVVTHNGIPEVSWHGKELNKVDWGEKSKTLALLLTADSKPGENIFIMINGQQEAQTYHLPKTTNDRKWLRVFDTALNEPIAIDNEPVLPLTNQKEYSLGNRSIAVFIS